MLNLPSEVESRFNAGFFAIRQKGGSFNGVWSEMATEKTITKDSILNVGETAHLHSRKFFIKDAKCASNKEFRTAISSFYEDISPMKVSWHLRRASQNRSVCQ
jgi:hypothetical protein